MTKRAVAEPEAQISGRIQTLQMIGAMRQGLHRVERVLQIRTDHLGIGFITTAVVMMTIRHPNVVLLLFGVFLVFVRILCNVHERGLIGLFYTAEESAALAAGEFARQSIYDFLVIGSLERLRIFKQLVRVGLLIVNQNLTREEINYIVQNDQEYLDLFRKVVGKPLVQYLPEHLRRLLFGADLVRDEPLLRRSSTTAGGAAEFSALSPAALAFSLSAGGRATPTAAQPALSRRGATRTFSLSKFGYSSRRGVATSKDVARKTRARTVGESDDDDEEITTTGGATTEEQEGASSTASSPSMAAGAGASVKGTSLVRRRALLCGQNALCPVAAEDVCRGATRSKLGRRGGATGACDPLSQQSPDPDESQSPASTPDEDVESGLDLPDVVAKVVSAAVGFYTSSFMSSDFVTTKEWERHFQGGPEQSFHLDRDTSTLEASPTRRTISTATGATTLLNTTCPDPGRPLPVGALSLERMSERAEPGSREVSRESTGDAPSETFLAKAFGGVFSFRGGGRQAAISRTPPRPTPLVVFDGANKREREDAVANAGDEKEEDDTDEQGLRKTSALDEEVGLDLKRVPLHGGTQSTQKPSASLSAQLRWFVGRSSPREEAKKARTIPAPGGTKFVGRPTTACIRHPLGSTARVVFSSILEHTPNITEAEKKKAVEVGSKFLQKRIREVEDVKTLVARKQADANERNQRTRGMLDANFDLSTFFWMRVQTFYRRHLEQRVYEALQVFGGFGVLFAAKGILEERARQSPAVLWCRAKLADAASTILNPSTLYVSLGISSGYLLYRARAALQFRNRLSQDPVA
ncbi:unnamed protein product [Amoebophrya sp. A120]|nr:unnamed protein product [Amoebophrya sp. A120]|eukprot:GSA120T00015380001.1